MMRWCVGTLALLVGLTLAPPVASAGDGDLSIDDLPTVDDSIVQDQISDVSIDTISDIDLDSLVTDVKTEVTEATETVVRLDSDILFGFGESKLPATAPKQIGDIVVDVPDGAGVSIGGHTDNIGKPASNQTLSEERAQAVADVIASARPDLKLTVKGFGETQPIEPNESGGKDNPEGRAKNRRVEIRYAS